MSQKALALKAYTESAPYGCYTSWPVLHTVELQLVTVGDEIPTDIDTFIDERVEDLLASVRMGFQSSDYPLFVRACPLNPRPGVLESSRADTTEEVAIIARRIITTMMSPDPSDKPMYDSGLIDPNGMLIVQRFINAHASAVVAPNNYILMGRDNDGITAGKDGLRVAIPLVHDPNVNKDFRKLDLDPDHIEIEFVSARKTPDITASLRSRFCVPQTVAMVQLRGTEGHRPIAPAPKGVTINGTFHGADRITINHIHLVSDNTDEQLDLMEQALREGMPEGSVVLHPNGSHLSHHAGQCFKYGVPYIASAEPQVGEQWTQAALGWVVLDNESTYKPQPYDPLDFTHAFIEGFDIGFSNYTRLHGWLTNHFHQFIGGPIGDAEQTAKLAGAYTAWLINATLSVGYGEMRHSPTTTTNSTPLMMATAYAIYGSKGWDRYDGISGVRENYYGVIEDNPITLESVVKMFTFLERVFSLQWSAGYGGGKYKQSCANGRMLAESVLEFFAHPIDENFRKMLSMANLVEHNVHNNGFFFNKFISKEALDWGTEPSSVRVQPNEFFSVYYAAEHILQSYPQPLTDVTGILDVSNKTTNQHMKKTPIASMANAIGASIESLPLVYRHPHGKHSIVGDSHFIQCGAKNCGTCKEHIALMNAVVVPIDGPQYESPFPVDESVTMFDALKELSLNPYTPNAPIALAKIMKTPLPTKAHKYIASIVSCFTFEQLQEFAKHQKKGDE